MERLATKNLQDWNNNSNRKPLIVWGARQVGKTYLVRDIFAEQFYKDSYIYIDFKIEDEIRDFCNLTANSNKIIEFISLQKEKPIDENVLLIFDEIQECPNIISALKYFCQDHKEIPVIATGSMVRIKLQRESRKRGINNNDKFLFPVGNINELTIYPISFEEFLLNSKKRLYTKIQDTYKNKEVLDNKIHELVLEEVYRYMLIGGMPEVVDTYLQTHDYLKALNILKELYNNYLADMDLYQASKESTLRSQNIFNNIFAELNKELKNFAPGIIEKHTKTRDYASAINWLMLAHIINPSYQLKEHITLPLIRENESDLRLYLGDMGMFSYQSGLNAASFISTDRENVLSGIYFENFVANELVAKGIKLYYWRGKASSELEFIVESNNKLFPIDVKKGKGTLTSLNHFANHNAYELAIKVSKNNYGFSKEKKILTIPYYYLPFVASDLANGTLE